METEFIALSAQLDSITYMVKNLTTTSTTATLPMMIEPVMHEPPMAQVNSISCVYCEGGHLFEECPSNPVSLHYVGNNTWGNNLYSNTYNPGFLPQGHEAQYYGQGSQQSKNHHLKLYSKPS